MKKLDNIIKSIGADKLLHMVVAMDMILIGGKFGDISVLVTWFVLVILSLLKEYYFDAREEGNAPDLGDMWWALFGAFVSTIYYIIATHV